MPPESPFYEKVPEKEAPQELLNTLKPFKIEENLLQNFILEQRLQENLKRISPILTKQIPISSLVNYLIEKKYPSGTHPEIELVLDKVMLLDPGLKSFYTLTLTPFDSSSQNPIPSQFTSESAPFPSNKEISLTDRLINAKEWAEDLISRTTDAIKGTVSKGADAITDAIQSGTELIENFFDKISKLVSLDKVPTSQIPILKNMIEAGQEAFYKIYKLGGQGNSIDCSGFVSLMLRAGKVFKKDEYQTSSNLFRTFSKHKIEKSGARAGDLLFRGNGGGGHVELIVGTPYQKGNKLYVKTLGSSSDSTQVSPMYNINGTDSHKNNGVAYRERYLDGRVVCRPKYEQLVKNNTKSKTS